MKVILNICGISPGHGVDKTIQKLLDEHNKIENTENYDKLKDLYSDYLLVGQKAVKLFSVETEIIEKLIILFQSYQVEKNVFLESYPFLLKEEKLKETDLLPKLVHIKDTDDNLSLVFCTRRSFTERTPINTEKLSNEFRSELNKVLNNYDEIFAIKHCIRQFFNVVVIWKKKKFIEIRVDIANGISSQERGTAFVETVEQFNCLVKERIGVDTLLKECINFFPLIDNLYKSNSEGKVCEITFTTDEGSIKSAKMRRRDVDIRNEMYHQAGIAAVHHITLYRLAISWSYKITEKITSHIELFLPGKLISLSATEQILEEVIIEKCSVIEEYNFIFDRIITYLNNAQ